MFERILTLYDFSPASQQALEWAVRLGSRVGANLKVLHAIFPVKLPAVQLDLAGRIRRDIDREAGILAQKCEGELKALDIEVIPGDVSAAALKTILNNDPDLVILGTHGRTGTARILMGSVAEKIVRHSPVPVLVARKAAAWPPRRVLIPVDWDDSAEEALLMASELSRVFPVHVELIHVITPATPLLFAPDLPGAVPYFDEAKARREIEDKLKFLALEHPRLSLVSHVALGHPATEICRKAEEINADLVIIPTHGRTGIPHFLMGSVAELVVRHAPCHVLSFCPSKGLSDRRQFLQKAARTGDEYQAPR